MQILLLGAGRTAHFLVHYIAKQIEENNWSLVIADFNSENFTSFIGLSEKISTVQLDIQNESRRRELVEKASAVISLLPANFHDVVAKDCLELKKHFFTASYVSEYLHSVREEIEAKGLFFLQELGLDPGLDHMSAMHILDDIRNKGGVIERFLSYTGGLMSPNLKDNPWQYKFTWNPQYIVTAGRDGGMYLRNGNIKRIPYHRLYKEIDDLHMPDHGVFDAYYNRNSLKYIDEYKLQNVKTVIRYTLRRQGFCQAWHPFVNLGMTDNLYQFQFAKEIRNRDFLNMFIRRGNGSLEARLSAIINEPIDGEVMNKLRWLGLFDETKIPLKLGTSAMFLQKILEPKWNIKQDEKDAIYMAHVCYYRLSNKLYKRKAYLAVEGKNAHETAMAKTVGLPLAIGVTKFLKGNIQEKGLCIPTSSKIYLPILKALADEGIGFSEVQEEKHGE